MSERSSPRFLMPVCQCADCAPREGRKPTHQVVCTCVETPCLACRTSGIKSSFLTPVAHGKHFGGGRARIDANKCQAMTGRDGRHRYDVAELREDGWPLCPFCGEDELYSQADPPAVDKICGCYICGTTYRPAAGGCADAPASPKIAPKMDLKRIFSYHPPTGDQPARYEAIRAGALAFVLLLDEHVPDCADKSAAIRHLRECVMTANAAVALGGIL
jgi:hypothetical protein